MDRRLDRMPGGFLSFGDDGIITATNLNLRTAFSYSDGALEGKHIEAILTVPSRIFYQTHLLPLLKMQGQLKEIYLTGLTSEKVELPLLLNAVRHEVDGELVNDCVIVPMGRRSEYEDEILRARKAAEEATREKERAVQDLRAAHGDLERQQKELQTRNQELEDLRGTLEDRVQRRTHELETLNSNLQSFNYWMAHDLRTPLRAIIATSAILLEETSGLLSDQHRDLLIAQKESAQKLASLVNDLLQLSRLGQQPIKAQSVDISALAVSASAEALSNQKRGDISFDVQADLSGAGDKELLRIVLLHLFENAVRYSPNGGAVTFGRKDIGGRPTFFVRDTGIGLDMAYSGKIFQPFQRLHRDEEFPGNGIGLAIVERIVNMHRGTVWVESSLGHGSTFFFTLIEIQSR